ncbi:hypothetical protein AvCA_10470 [Azotobacter vinelandii CA]|uniref:Uncharacterized protein n=2 Tax=Azotobacter vinelandii TaxID=354 RepID=C1DNR3_AZOVD|nr:hypothetical protein Avin_10470 [Azotobacter vinelandii DJ]AGK15422.1 hypothetical protein AvCA_10470 [Azotobacter vinelandii CA]AGK19688.1 hypothetical protein AvCA6_10470 [Azotobacter vinelandii CA6]
MARRGVPSHEPAPGFPFLDGGCGGGGW